MLTSPFANCIVRDFAQLRNFACGPGPTQECFGAISLPSCDMREARLTSQPAGHAWGSARLISIVQDFAQLRYFAFGPGPTPGVLWWY